MADPVFEFAELICDRREFSTAKGQVAMFTIQFVVFPHPAGGPVDRVALPVIHMAADQAPHLLGALRAALWKKFPNEMQAHTDAADSSGTTAAPLN
jgi:hypothetical protein